MSHLADPLELLTNKGDRKPTFLGDIWNPMFCAVGGFGLGMFLNWGFRKPVFSGIQKHIGLMAVCGGLGKYFDNQRNAYMAKRDAVLRHYVELHPEDFPVVERTKYADVLEVWAPIR